MSPSFDACPIPCRAGVALGPHIGREILDGWDFQGWVEANADDHTGEGGSAHQLLSAVRERFPLSIHSTGLSIGGEGGFSREHLSHFASIVKRFEPGLVSAHLASPSQSGKDKEASLPPYALRALTRAALHIDEVQVALRRKILIKNPSAFVQFAGDDFPEPDFLRALVRRTGCGLLLDIKTARDSALKRGLDPFAYVDAFPLAHVEEIHLAGCEPQAAGPVWTLYEHVLTRTGPVPTLVACGHDGPDPSTLVAEAARVDAVMQRIAPQLSGRLHARVA